MANGVKSPIVGSVGRRGLLIGAGGMVATAAIATPVARWLDARDRPVARMLRQQPFTVAHRGGSSDWPEMSQYAYQQSVSAGVDALEMSVGRTSDGVWVGVHDVSLDRTSGTHGFVVAEHTFAELSQHQILPPGGHPDQAPRPYWRLDEFIDTYRNSHSLWVDPKAVDPRHYPELISVMKAHQPHLASTFVAKSGAANSAWAQLAVSNKMDSWGFYFVQDLDADPGLFARPKQPWTMLGLDWNASDIWWRRFEADGRPLVAHVLYEASQRPTALSRGARGLMIAGITEVLG